MNALLLHLHTALFLSDNSICVCGLRMFQTAQINGSFFAEVLVRWGLACLHGITT